MFSFGISQYFQPEFCITRMELIAQSLHHASLAPRVDSRPSVPCPTTETNRPTHPRKRVDHPQTAGRAPRSQRTRSSYCCSNHSPAKVGLHSPGNNSQLLKKSPRRSTPLSSWSAGRVVRRLDRGKSAFSRSWKPAGKPLLGKGLVAIFPRERKERSRGAQPAQLTTNSGMRYRSEANRPTLVPFVGPRRSPPRALSPQSPEDENSAGLT